MNKRCDKNTSEMVYDFICHTIEQAEAFAKSANCSLVDLIGNTTVNECLRILYSELHRDIITAIMLLRSGVVK